MALLTIAACGGEADGRTQVVTGLYPLEFLADEIGGAEVTVTNVTPPGAEPHDVELTPRSVARVADAEVVLLAGGVQPALDRAAERAGGEVVDVLADAKLVHAEDGHGEAGVDPHIWLDPALFAEAARRVGAALEEREAATAFVSRLEALDREFAQGLAQCERHEIVTSHAAFGYLAERYGLEQIPITGLSPEAEPSPRELERVVRVVEASGATTVFFETLVSPRLAETVARETGAATAVLNPIEGLTAEQIESGANYFSLMRANLAALRKALGCR